MADLLINRPITLQQQGYTNNPKDNVAKENINQPSNNSDVNDIQSSDTYWEKYTTYLRQKEKQYRENLKDEKNQKYIFAVAGGLTLILGGVSLIFGRKNLVNIREKLNLNVEFMQNLKDSKQIKALGNAKLTAIKFLNNALGYMFSFDKVKDFSLLKGFEALGKPGKMAVSVSKSSLWITEKTTLTGLYKTFSMKVNAVGSSVDKALKIPKNFSNEQEKRLAERLNILLNGNKESKGLIQFADDLETGLKGRTVKLKNIIQKENIDPYRQKYYPTAFTWSEIKRAGTNWKKSLFSVEGNKDILRENWAKTEDILLNNINKTGKNNGKIKNFGQAMKQVASITKEMDELFNKQDCSQEFKNLTKQVRNLNQTINNSKSSINPINFEISGDKYAGRVLDLAAGGGMTEIIIAPVVAGVVAYKTLKNSKPGERKEKFVRNGGPEVVGGIAGWMVTANLLSISGPVGMLAGLVTAGIMNVFSKSYLKHLDKTQKTQNL